MDNRSIRQWRQETGTPGMMCRTCRHGLNPLRTTSTVLWVHAMTADHVPDPVPVTDDHDRILVCDFCGVAEVVWNYPTRNVSITGNITLPDFSSDNLTTLNTGEDWASCLACHEIIQKGDRIALANRCGEKIAERNGLQRYAAQELARNALEMQTEAFWNARNGDPWPEPRCGYTLAQLEEMLGPNEE